MKAKEVRAQIDLLYEEQCKIQASADQAIKSLELQIKEVQKQCRHKRVTVGGFFPHYACKYCDLEMEPPEREGVER